MILSKVYEDAENRLERNEITIGEFGRLVDIEVIEPKRGKWVEIEPHKYSCSKCGCVCGRFGNRSHPLKGNVWNYNFCPNCGAMMKGADGDV